MNSGLLSRHRYLRYVVLAGVSLLMLFANGGRAALNAAGPLTVRTVPWKGDPTAGHPVYPNGVLVLQGVATLGVNDTATPLTSAVWDPGDGTAPVAVAFGNSLNLELTHTYAAANVSVGVPIYATLTVTNSTSTASATFKVLPEAKSLDVEQDMAIDKGLWYLWKIAVRSIVGASVPAAQWDYNGYSASTGSAVQAFEINNHRESNDATVDPYVHIVARGLAKLQSGLVATGNITCVANGSSCMGNPDTNGNNIGLYYNDYGSYNYLLGQVVDAFVASGTPDAVAVTGNATYVLGRKYKDIVQDMMDFSWYGQLKPNCGADGPYPRRGSWGYNPNDCHSDNSTAQWPAIGGIAAERVWHITPPAFAKSENLAWLHTNQTMGATAATTDGQFGYGAGYGQGCAWADCQATTPSGLVQLIFDGAKYNPAAARDGSDEDRFKRGVQHIARKMRDWNDWPGNWAALPGSRGDSFAGDQNFYAMYATKKALGLAVDGDPTSATFGKPKPITLISDGSGLSAFDWYRSDPATSCNRVANPACTLAPYGMARGVIARQLADGHWAGASNWTNPLSTEYAIIILSPSLFELGPKAVCQATPNEIGSFGGSVNFTSTGTIEQNPDPNVVITEYTWNFGDGSPDQVGASDNATHTYGAGTPTTYPATLTVKDSNGNTSTASCPVTQVNTDVKPNADLGSNTDVPGEYLYCQGSNTPLILDGSASSDPDMGDGISKYEWDITTPLNFTPADSTNATFDVTSVYSAKGPGVYDIALRVTDNPPSSKTDAKSGHVTVKLATDPSCNQPPVAVSDNFSTNEDTTLNANVRTNDTDDHGITSTILVSGTSNGALVLNADGTFSYTPTANYNGPDSFTYKDNDGQYDSNVATVNINVIPVDDAPVAADDAAMTSEDTPVGGNVLTNDTDVDNPSSMLTAALVSGPSSGSVVLNSDGSFTYTPNANFNGTDTFTYAVSDGESTSNTATVTITVNPVNDAPVANPDAATTAEDMGIDIAVLANDYDVDSPAPTVASVTQPANGSVIVNPDGTITYTPDANFNGTDTFTYQATDGSLLSAPTTVTVTVTPVNDAPVAQNSFVSTPEDTSVSSQVVVSDVDNATLTVTLVSGPSHGTLTLNADGTFTYLPFLNYNGPDSFTFQASDGELTSNIGTVNIGVAPVDDAPVCSLATPSIKEIWPPDHTMVPVTINGVTDLDSASVAITITGIYQDEPTNTVGDGNTPSDAAGIGSSLAQVRAERSGTPKVPGNGRVYHIQFTGSDGTLSCTGEVTVGVPHDQGTKRSLIDDGIKFNSVTGAQVP